ncbi:AraC family transcriptional regulator [Pseudomonas sp. G11-1]|uniref:AraC-type DNA-binding protein n=1 Tax=Halopseudomonas bauzanensis TaxID=653930 RepID=A0A1H9UPZ4_9GAMM|nr:MULTISPECIES: AraC family transcriptional regulator [Halopseudomonas]MCO5786107.1 AraC family transcriptional regulator [Pseudomonas sp. G11-1]MCO5789333.1 AraC family transcriptional regulator [Pseudomonas sp. G11-2]WGK62960.1 AraC family transcriptional regulator [Halopseudomonas sp. SMJS2]SES11600.1 transcriptional regulator, AraC family [Halopseudomonas bauzanensis]SFM10975.1 AraC-type DNA-binding protein [Halopseudomonas bauzanensis]
MKLGDLSVGYLYSLQAALRSLGHDPEPLLQRYRIGPAQLAQAGVRISIPRFMRLGHAAIALSGRADFGLLMGLHSQPSHLGLPGVTAQCAPTLGQAFDILVRFERLVSQNYRGHSSFQPPATRFYSISPYNAFNLFVVDSALASRLQLARQLTAGAARLREVHIEFPAPDYAERYEALFGCPVLFEQHHNQLLWEPASLELQPVQHAATTHEQLLTLCDQQLRELTRHRRLRERVEEIVSPQLHSRLPTLDEVAGLLGLPGWTLRRRLRIEDNTRFQDIIDDIRRDLALSYIRDTETALGEVSFLLGFSSPAAFQRAFKRWTGVAPGQYRRQSRDVVIRQSN